MSGERVLIEREIVIAASPETIFPFLVDPRLMGRWFGTKHTLEPRPGGVFDVQVNPEHRARGVFTEVVPNRRVAFTWGWESKMIVFVVGFPGGSDGQSPSGFSGNTLEALPRDLRGPVGAQRDSPVPAPGCDSICPRSGKGLFAREAGEQRLQLFCRKDRLRSRGLSQGFSLSALL